NASANAKPGHVALLRQLCATRAQAYADYDSARQIVAAMLAVAGELPKAPAGFANALAALQKEYDLEPNNGRRQRLLLIKQKFEETSKEKFLADASAQEALETIANKGILEALKDPSQDTAKRELTRFLD